MPDPILRIEAVAKAFPLPSSLWSRLRRRPADRIRALCGVSLDVDEGEVIGIVGESGCGKSTLARAIVRLVELDAGRILFRGRDIREIEGAERRRIQMIFQDPYASLNPRVTIGRALAEPLRVHSIVPRPDIKGEVARLLGRVGLSADLAARYPSELSGGQRQRVGVARALSVRPEVLIADEAVSGLDASVRAQALDLLGELRRELGLTLIFIAHDLRAVESISDRVGVMYMGHLVELGPAARVFSAPAHPYTRGLLAAVPSLDPGARPERPALEGELPSPVNPPSGCALRTRCPLARAVCESPPPVVRLAAGHTAACHLAGEREQGGMTATARAP